MGSAARRAGSSNRLLSRAHNESGRREGAGDPTGRAAEGGLALKIALGIDLGAKGRNWAVVGGREYINGPELLDLCPGVPAVKRFPKWEPTLVRENLQLLVRDLRPRAIGVEATFTHSDPRLRDVGRKQAGPSGFVEGLCALWGIEFVEVSTVDAVEAMQAWSVLGRPEEGKPTGFKTDRNEHVRDACGVLLKTFARMSGRTW